MRDGKNLITTSPHLLNQVEFGKLRSMVFPGLNSMPRRWQDAMRVALVVGLIWLVFVGLLSAFTYVDMNRAGREVTYLRAFKFYGLGFFCWLFLGPLNFAIARDLGMEGSRLRTIVLVAIGSILTSLVIIFAYVLLFYAPLMGQTAGEVLKSLQLIDWAWDTILFGTIYLSGLALGQRVRTPPPESSSPTRVAVKSAGRIDYIEIDDILAVSAQSNYVELICAERTHLHRSTLSSFIEQYADAGFIQIHRSHYVRASAVESIRANGGQGRRVILKTGQNLPIAKNYWSGIEEEIGG